MDKGLSKNGHTYLDISWVPSSAGPGWSRRPETPCVGHLFTPWTSMSQSLRILFMWFYVALPESLSQYCGWSGSSWRFPLQFLCPQTSKSSRVRILELGQERLSTALRLVVSTSLTKLINNPLSGSIWYYLVFQPHIESCWNLNLLWVHSQLVVEVKPPWWNYHFQLRSFIMQWLFHGNSQTMVHGDPQCIKGAYRSR